MNSINLGGKLADDPRIAHDYDLISEMARFGTHAYFPSLTANNDYERNMREKFPKTAVIKNDHY